MGCEHNRKGAGKQCGWASICEHNRRRSECKECGGASICERAQPPKKQVQGMRRGELLRVEPQKKPVQAMRWACRRSRCKQFLGHAVRRFVRSAAFAQPPKKPLEGSQTPMCSSLSRSRPAIAGHALNPLLLIPRS
jgi:hypothetical protein